MSKGRLARRIEDKRVLKLVRKYLQAGMWRHGVYEERKEGTPQGGPLSPLIGNILLDDLDKELRKRSHRFCRYADDCNIYVRSSEAAKRVMGSIKRYIEGKLKLRVNEKKSQAGHVSKGVFLGYTISGEGVMRASKESINRLKGKVRYVTRRNKGRNIEEVIRRVNEVVVGWRNYFIYDKRKGVYEKIEGWIKRRIRSYRLKQGKRSMTIARWLVRLGIEQEAAKQIGGSSKGWWRLSKTKQLHMAMNNGWFKEVGLKSIIR